MRKQERRKGEVNINKTGNCRFKAEIKGQRKRREVRQDDREHTRAGRDDNKG